MKALTDRIRRLERIEELFTKLRREGCLPYSEFVELVDSVVADVEFLARTYGGGYRPRSLTALLAKLKELAGSYECVPSLETLLASLRRTILLALPIPVPPPIAEELSERLPEILRSTIGFAVEDLASDLGFTLQLLIRDLGAAYGQLADRIARHGLTEDELRQVGRDGLGYIAEALAIAFLAVVKGGAWRLAEKRWARVAGEKITELDLIARDVEFGVVKLHLAEVKVNPRKLSPEKLVAGKLKPLYEETRSYEIGRDVCVREVAAITFNEVTEEWEDKFKARVRKAVEEQNMKMCSEGLNVNIITPSKMIKLAREAGAHSLASAIEVFTKFIQGKK
ncbi:hypothetical protein [Pyrodictium abyssi]|uniref:Uncharacterized protein n=1 Tax=Pyrodictium abyssi TaxID=54256 RepID=A0ABN6ZMJ3_9CREN|nr:hypothetical protein PABY_10110 [Pyrodictium abyssi]